MFRYVGACVALFSFAFMNASFPVAYAAMTSTNYQIQWDSVTAGGNDTASSASYIMRSSLGTVTSGTSTSTSYQESSGYRAGVYDPAVQFNVRAQDRTTQVAASALAGSTVTVTSTAGFTVGDYIMVVQNEGGSQVTATGLISAIASPVLTVDIFRTNGTTPTIDGTNDYVYRLSGTTVNLGTLSPSATATSVIAWDVNADVSQGYSVYVYENRDLTSSGASVTIADVADGTVTAGASEYGGVSSDTSLALSTFDTQDTAVTTSLQQVASRGDNSFEARDFFTLKVAVSSALESGTYSNSMTFVFVGDY